jgi:phage tail-like protein
VADPTSDPAVSVCFTVAVDGYDLGEFTGCDGLSVEVQLESREEGGNNLFVHQLPGRFKFSNLKLTRVINKDTQTVAKWLSSMSTYGIKRSTAHVAAMTADGKKIAEWTLDGCIPVKWQGPSLNVDTLKVATETLEIAHHGFIEIKGRP